MSVYGCLWIFLTLANIQNPIAQYIYENSLKLNNSIKIQITKRYSVLYVEKFYGHLVLSNGYIPTLKFESDNKYAYTLALHDRTSNAWITIYKYKKSENSKFICMADCIHTKINYKNNTNIDKYTIKKFNAYFLYFPDLNIYLSTSSDLDINDIEIDFIENNVPVAKSIPKI